MKQILKFMLLATIILMDVLGSAEVDIFVPSFPELRELFKLTSFWVEAMLSVNFVGYFLCLLYVGGLADRYGRKPVILSGIMIFIIGSILCRWAPSYAYLLTGRFLQGVGVAAPAILSFLIIADSYPMKQQQYYMGILNGIMNICVAGAPVVGSYITQHFHWQGNFMALLVLGIIVFIMTLFFVPNSKLPAHKEPLSLRGFIPIFQAKPLMLLNMTLVLTCVPYWLFLGMSPLLYIESLGVSLENYGYYQGAWALVFALGSIVGGVFINRYDPLEMLKLALYTSIIGFIFIAAVTLLDSHDPLVIMLAFLPFSVSGIIPAIILYPLVLSYMPEAKGRVSAVIQGGRLILTAISLEFAGYFYQGSFQNIGIIISVYVFMAVVGLYLVMKNHALMQHLRGDSRSE